MTEAFRALATFAVGAAVAAAATPLVARLARAGQRDGSFKDGRPDDLALVFWTTVKGLALHRLALGSAYKSPDPRILTRIFFSKTAA